MVSLRSTDRIGCVSSGLSCASAPEVLIDVEATCLCARNRRTWLRPPFNPNDAQTSLVGCRMQQGRLSVDTTFPAYALHMQSRIPAGLSLCHKNSPGPAPKRFRATNPINAAITRAWKQTGQHVTPAQPPSSKRPKFVLRLFNRRRFFLPLDGLGGVCLLHWRLRLFP